MWGECGAVSMGLLWIVQHRCRHRHPYMYQLNGPPCHRGGSLWDLVPRESVGPPQHYVCHAWGANLVDVVDQLVNRLLSHGK